MSPLSSLLTRVQNYVISGFRRDVNEICALLEIYAAWDGSFLPTFRDNLSVPSLRAKRSAGLGLLDLKCGTDRSLVETSVRNYHSTLRKFPGEGRYQVFRNDTRYICTKLHGVI